MDNVCRKSYIFLALHTAFFHVNISLQHKIILEDIFAKIIANRMNQGLKDLQTRNIRYDEKTRKVVEYYFNANQVIENQFPLDQDDVLMKYRSTLYNIQMPNLWRQRLHFNQQLNIGLFQVYFEETEDIGKKKKSKKDKNEENQQVKENISIQQQEELIGEIKEQKISKKQEKENKKIEKELKRSLALQKIDMSDYQGRRSSRKAAEDAREKLKQYLQQ